MLATPAWMCGMDDKQLETALDRLEQALGKAEALLKRRGTAAAEAADEVSAKAAQLAALEARHGDLKRAVAQGLRQLDEILAGLPK